MKKNGAVRIIALVMLGMMLLDGCQGMPPEGYNCKTDFSWGSSLGQFSGSNGVGTSYNGGTAQYRTSLDSGSFSVSGENYESTGNGGSNTASGFDTAVTGETDGTQAGSADSYMITDSSRRYLTAEELSGLNAWELKVARNEIYARHGVLFGEGAIQDHFNTRTWYHGTIEASAFDSSVLNEYEWANIQTIQSVEAAKAW